VTVYHLEKTFDFDRAVEDGTLFTASHIFPAVPSMGVVYAHIRTTSRRVAIKAQVSGTGHLIVRSYIGTTYTSEGVPTLLCPRNIGTSYNPVSVLRYSPVINVLGALRLEQNVSGGDKHSTSVGSFMQDGFSLIIPPNVDILLSITNQNQDAGDVGLIANFIEEVL
jgi:hypothetical protein